VRAAELREDHDEAAFGALLERHRRELQLHCYRMVGSLEDAEDLVQETLLRAWRARSGFGFRGDAQARAWLYRIATNACLDFLAAHSRRARGAGEGATGAAEVAWLQPYPDRLLEGIAPADAEPDTAAIAKETVELVFLVAIQHLPPRQRAVLILRDLLGWSAQDTATILGGSVAAVNSALQRARATVKRLLPARRHEWAATADPSETERALLERFIEAHERADAAALADLLAAHARAAMPPLPTVWDGRDAIVSAMAESPFQPEFGPMRMVPIRANRQPAAATYRRPPGAAEFQGIGINVLRIEDGLVVEMLSFPCRPLGPRFTEAEVPDLLPAFGLPTSFR
jgi:RNA polymerase sigma-70 factor, ECF subfamily